MADDDDDLIDDDVTEEPEPDEPDAPSVDETIEDLRKQIASERAARLEDQKARIAAEKRASVAEVEVDDTNLQLVESALDTVNRDMFDLKAQMAEALRVGDHAGAAEIQDGITERRIQIQQLENGRDRMKQAKEAPKTQQTRPVQPLLPDVDTFAGQLTPRSADWVRSHPEFVTNPALNARMVNAHNFVIADGVAPDTDEYFDRVETMLRIKKTVDADSEAQVARRPASPPAAPANTGGGGRPGNVRLSAQEREFARDSDMTEAEYAANKSRLIKEGRIKA
jgi:hypothetical protein